MAEALPARPNLEWLKKTAKQHLRELRAGNPETRLAEAQLAVARRFGFSSWRAPMMLTYYRERPDMRAALLARGARIGVVEALLAGDDDAVRRMLRAGKSALPPDPNGGSILAFARTAYAIDRLLELGAERDVKDRWSTAPIEAMSRLGPRGLPLVKHLLSRGVAAPPEVYARVGDKHAIEALLAKKSGLINSDDLLLGAVDFGHYELVQWLLDKGANPNARSSIGSQGTALHSAAWEGDLKMAQLLVAAGADLEARDREHNGTPEEWARVSIEITNNPHCREVAEYLGQAAKRAAP